MKDPDPTFRHFSESRADSIREHQRDQDDQKEHKDILMDIKECKSVEDYRDAAHFWQKKWKGESKALAALRREVEEKTAQLATMTKERDEARKDFGYMHEQVVKRTKERDTALARAEAGEKDTARLVIINRFMLTVGRAGYRGRNGWEVTEADPGGHYQEERRRTIGYGETANEAIDKAIETLELSYGTDLVRAAIDAATANKGEGEA